ncbi:hypothetical protein HR15_11135 [Porphyromonas gulae]|uniref:Uncharacterized protein n=1 Tax=Porphyromonas gulae TaxID=111105 RepID=A0A0A2F7D5_9PORP|nr:hypothetical protein HR15_11135 [Porphyromonas gulae]
MGEAMFPNEGKSAFSVIHIILFFVCAFFWVPTYGWFWGILRALFWEFILLYKIIVWMWNLLF